MESLLKKEDLNKIYKIESVSGREFLSDIYKIINEKYKYFLLLFVNFLVYQNTGTRFTGSVYEKFG